MMVMRAMKRVHLDVRVFGDVPPYVAIALELKRRGHRPLSPLRRFTEKTDALGLELYLARIAGYARPKRSRGDLGE